MFWAQLTKLGVDFRQTTSLSHLGETGGAIICRCGWLTVRIRGTDINGITRQDTGGVAVERDTRAPQLQVLAHIGTLCNRPPIGSLMPLMTGHEGCTTNLQCVLIYAARKILI